MTGVNLFNVDGNLDLTATGDLTVVSGAVIQTGMGTISLAADVNSDGTGDDRIGTLTIAAEATVTSSHAAADAITLRGADIDVDTGARPAVIGTARLLDTVPSAVLTGVQDPFDLAVDRAGNVYVADTIANTVEGFAPGATTPTTTLTGLNTPVALAIDANGYLYVAHGAGFTVSKFAPGATTPTATLTGVFEVAHRLRRACSVGRRFCTTSEKPWKTRPRRACSVERMIRSLHARRANHCFHRASSAGSGKPWDLRCSA